MSRQHPVEATQAAIHRTIPSTRMVLSVSPASLKKLCNKYVWLRGSADGVTILRGSTTPAAGEGFVLSKDRFEEFFIDASDHCMLGFVGGSVEILYDA